MSLDVSLFVNKPMPAKPRTAIFVRRGGATVEITREEWDEFNPGVKPVMAVVNADAGNRTEVYSANITHNLGKMAGAAGIYQHLWRPEEIDITKARELIEPLAAGLALLKSDSPRFEAFNSPNGWGMYENLVSFVAGYLEACRQHPDADISADR